MKYEELKTKSQDELKKMLLDLKKQQMDSRFQHAGGQMEKTDQLRKLRRDIARVQTAMNAPAETKAAPKKKTTKKAA